MYSCKENLRPLIHMQRFKLKRNDAGTL